MQYKTYERDVVQKYKVHLKGWPLDSFVSPSDMSNSLPPLQQLLDALESKTCQFVKLTSAEVEARKAQWEADIAAGKVAPLAPNKKRKDARKKRAPASLSRRRTFSVERLEGVTGRVVRSRVAVTKMRSRVKRRATVLRSANVCTPKFPGDTDSSRTPIHSPSTLPQ